jgi:arylsulfatase A-like enzyme
MRSDGTSRRGKVTVVAGHEWRQVARVAGRAATGVAGACLVYGVLETVFADFARFAIFALVVRSRVPGVSVAGAVASVATYGLVGGVVGAILGACVAGFGRPARGSAVSWFAVGGLGVACAFAANAAAFWPPALPGAAAALGLALLGLRAQRQPHAEARAAVFANPWFTATLLLATAFLSEPRWYIGTAWRVMSVTGAGLAVSAAAWFGAPYRVRVFAVLPRAVRGAGPVLLGVLTFATALGIPALAGRLAPGLGRPVVWTAGASARRPNVLLISLDTVRADHLALYGYRRDTTPNLARLVAAGAAVYPRAIAASNHTLASHASLLTGLTVAHHGAHFAAPPGRDPVAVGLPEGVPTLAERLAGQGYSTAAVVTNTLFLHAGFGFARGFSIFECREPASPFGPAKPYLLRRLARRLAIGFGWPASSERRFVSADTVTHRALSILEAAHRAGRPWFVFLNYMDAHVPYEPPPPYDARFAGRDPAFSWNRYPAILDAVMLRRARQISESDRRHLESQYDGAIAFEDAQVGRLCDGLRALGAFDDTLIIVTSDHGEAFGEHGAVGHGVTVYDVEVHVPLVIKYPGRLARASHLGPVAAVDIVPTVLEVVGAPEAPLDGRSLVHGPGPDRRFVVTQSSGAGRIEAPGDPTALPLFALYDGPLKAIRRHDGTTEVYDVAADPSESRALSPAVLDPGWVVELTRAAAGQTLSAPRWLVDPEERERLRSLGYVR